MGVSNRSIRNRITLSACAVLAAIAFMPTFVSAQELKPTGGSTPALGAGNEPVLVVTVASMSKLMQDVNYVTGAMGQPQAGGMFQMMAATFTQGIDPTQPVGIFVTMVDGAPEPIAVIPSADINTVLDRLKAQLGPVDKLDDGTLAIAVGVNTIYIRQNGGWATLARNRDLLKLAPADPTPLFEGMGNDYDLAFRVKMQQVPQDTRDMLIAQMRQGFEQAMAQQNNGDADATRKMAKNSMDQIALAIKDTDELSFGFNIDSAGNRLVTDFAFTAVPGSDLADMYVGQKPIPSRFASVIRPAAAAYYHGATSISPKSIDQAKTSVQTSINTIRGALANEDSLSADDQAEIAAIIDRIADLAVDSISEGKIDLGAVLIAEPEEFRFVMGAFVSDGKEVVEIVKELADKVKNEPDAPTFKFDQGTYNGVTMHVIEAEVPADEEEVRQIFGDTLRVHLGTADKAVYLAIGDDCVKEMQQLIDSGDTDGGGARPLAQLQFTLLPILQYAQSVQENDVVAAMITALSAAPDPGRISVISDTVQNGQKSQIIMGEGLFKAIGAAVSAAQRAQFQGQF